MHPHGEKVGGAERAPRPRKPPDRAGLWDTALKECRGEKYARALDHSGNREGISNALFNLSALRLKSTRLYSEPKERTNM